MLVHAPVEQSEDRVQEPLILVMCIHGRDDHFVPQRLEHLTELRLIELRMQHELIERIGHMRDRMGPAFPGHVASRVDFTIEIRQQLRFQHVDVRFRQEVLLPVLKHDQGEQQRRERPREDGVRSRLADAMEQVILERRLEQVRQLLVRQTLVLDDEPVKQRVNQLVSELGIGRADMMEHRLDDLLFVKFLQPDCPVLHVRQHRFQILLMIDNVLIHVSSHSPIIHLLITFSTPRRLTPLHTKSRRGYACCVRIIIRGQVGAEAKASPRKRRP